MDLPYPMLMLTTAVTMANNSINNFLLKKWSEFDHGIPLNRVMDEVRGHVYRPSFFLRTELYFTTPKEWRNAMNRGFVHHCKPHNGKWYDYMSNRHYDTIEDWVSSCGSTLDDVLFGVNRIYSNHKSIHIHIHQLLDKLGYLDTFTSIAKSLDLDDSLVDTRLCLAKRPNGSISVSKIRDKKFDSVDPQSSSNIVICVPMDNEDNIVEYSRRSDLPSGMTIYLRATCGAFYSLEDLLTNRVL